MRLLPLFLLLYFTNFSCLKAQALIKPSMSRALDQQLIENNKRYGIVAQSVLVLKNNQLMYRGQQGFANLELAVPISMGHIYPGYSVTKLFTSVLMMQLVEQGSVDLKASIRHYLPYLPERWQQVTVEHTLNHTSGIPRYFDIAMKKGQFLPSIKEVLLSLSGEADHFEMGTSNRYNNTNFLILSAILTAKTGKSYQELVDSIIIKPLKLEHTGHASAKAIIANMVSSYRGQDGVLRKNRNIDWPEYTFSHSGLYSTPENLATFMTALVSGKFVSLASLKQMWQPMKLNNGDSGYYAFGFEYQQRDGYTQVGHDGGNVIKLRHYFTEQPGKHSYTLAYLTNGNGHSVWTDILADSVMSIIDPQQFKQAGLGEYFMSEILNKDTDKLQGLYERVSTAFHGNTSAIEDFITTRAYAVRYGLGAKASIPVFTLLTEKFPGSAHGWRRLADTWQVLGDKERAIKNYKLALEIDPGLIRAIKQLKALSE